MNGRSIPSPVRVRRTDSGVGVVWSGLKNLGIAGRADVDHLLRRQPQDRKAVRPGRLRDRQKRIVPRDRLQDVVVSHQDGVDAHLVLEEEGDQVVNDRHHLRPSLRPARGCIRGPFFERAEHDEGVEIVGVRRGESVHERVHDLAQFPARADRADRGAGRLRDSIGREIVVDVEHVFVVVVTGKQGGHEVRAVTPDPPGSVVGRLNGEHVESDSHR